MQALSIKELLILKPGSPVMLAGGRLKAVSSRQTGSDPQYGPWSIQNLFIEDAGGEIAVKVGNHDEIPTTMIGKDLVFVAHRKSKGGLSGLKIELEEYKENNLDKSFLVLSVARSGTILTGEEWEKREAELTKQEAQQPQQTLPVATGPAAQQQTLPPVTQTAVNPVEKPAAPPPEAKPSGGIHLKELSYARTVNTGNHCSEKMSVTIDVEEGVNPNKAVDAMKAFLTKHLPQEVIAPGARPVVTP